MQAIEQCMSFFGWLFGSSGAAKSPALAEAERAFTKEELAAIHWEHCCHVIDKYTPCVDYAHFLEWCGLQTAAPALAKGLCEAVHSQHIKEGVTGATQQGQVSLDAIIISKAKLEKLDQAGQMQFAFAILDPNGDGAVTRAHLQECVSACLDLAMQSVGEHGDHQAHAAAIAEGASTFSEEPDQLTFAGYRKWSKVMPAVHNVLLALLRNIGRSAAEPLLAECGQQSSLPSPIRAQLPVLAWVQASRTDCLLQPEHVWLLQAGLPPDLRQEWRCLFSSYRHGMSFSTFIARIANTAPTLVLIRDSGGHTFGGIAYQPWVKTGSFYGSTASSILSLEPKAVVYPASGINTNIQWCGVGFSELPNGIGFGGQQGHFGVWIDASMDTGMSRPNATFASPSLSHQQTFSIEAVECWLLKPPEDEEEAAQQKGAKGKSGVSAMDKAKGDQQIMEWAGRVQYSAGLRDEPLEED